MKRFAGLVIFIFVSIAGPAQTLDSGGLKIIGASVDSGQIWKQDLALYKLPGTGHNVPLYIANGVVVSPDELNPDAITSIEIFKQPSLNGTYGAAGVNGIIFIKTKKAIDSISLSSLYTGDECTPLKKTVEFALNGYHVKNKALLISPQAIKGVESLRNVTVGGVLIQECVSVWTIPEKDRIVYLPKGCGLRISAVADLSEK